MSTVDWNKPTSGRGKMKCWIRGCDKTREAHIMVAIRIPNVDSGGKLVPGYGRMVASKSHGFCKEHAEMLWARLLPLVDSGEEP